MASCYHRRGRQQIGDDGHEHTFVDRLIPFVFYLSERNRNLASHDQDQLWECILVSVWTVAL